MAPGPARAKAAIVAGALRLWCAIAAERLISRGAGALVRSELQSVKSEPKGRIQDLRVDMQDVRGDIRTTALHVMHLR